MTPEDIREANDAADILRAEAQRLNAIAWALDSALSLRRKADPRTGYRSNPLLGDAAWNAGACDQAVGRAYLQALPDLLRLRPGWHWARVAQAVRGAWGAAWGGEQ